MIDRQLLQHAATRDIITTDQVEPLYRFLQQHADNGDQLAPEEPLRFIRSFGDIFISIGVLILVYAINMAQLQGLYHLLPALGFVMIAEWLVRIRRLSLPGIAILLALLYFVNRAIEFDQHNATVLDIGLLSLTSLLFYLRYRMPFSLLPVAAGIVAICIIQIGLDLLEHPVIFVGLGLVVFVAAMLFDVSDTKRQSHLSDTAFWLHLLAAPLIVHGAMVSMLFSGHPWISLLGKEVLIVAFFTAFFLLALLIDRRALLISTQLYVIYALTRLLQEQLSNTQNILMLVLMGLGFVVIFFGSYWYLLRRWLFGFLGSTFIGRLVPSFDTRDSRF